jgi:serine protease AprX
MGAPADGDSVFAIGAVNAAGIRSSFSSVGPTYDRRISPVVVAQGSGTAIYTPAGLTSGSGTSFSSPIICGITACFWQANLSMNNQQVMDAIKATGSQASAPDSLLGWGIPNFKDVTTSAPDTKVIAAKKLSAFPNPVIDKVTLDFPEAMYGNYKIEIFSIQGKSVYSRQGADTSIRSLQINDIENLPSGIYFINVLNNSTNYSCRIIKI